MSVACRCNGVVFVDLGSGRRRGWFSTLEELHPPPVIGELQHHLSKAHQRSDPSPALARNYGLMQAVKRFNPFKGVKLSSYSAWWIRAYILKFLMDTRGPVRIGTTAAQRKLFYNLRKETEKLLRDYETADPKLLAENLGVKEKEVIAMQQRLNAHDVSFDAPLSDGSGRTHSDVIDVESTEKSADDQIADNELLEIFEEHLIEFRTTLKGRDLDVFNDRLMAEKPLTLQELGDRYGISRERARQIEARIMKNLKEFVRKKGTLSELMDDEALTTIDA